MVDVSHYVNFSLDERHLLSSPGIVLRQDFDGRGAVVPAVLRVPDHATVALSALLYLLYNITPIIGDFGEFQWTTNFSVWPGMSRYM